MICGDALCRSKCDPGQQRMKKLQVNTFLYLFYAYAKEFNVSSCWISLHTPIHSKRRNPL